MRSFIIVFIYMIKAEPLLDLYFSTWRLERVSEKGIKYMKSILLSSWR